MTSEQRAEIARLHALGYAAATDDYREEKGVTRHDPRRSQRGLNFFVSGHGPEAQLVDMEGRVVHRWAKPFQDLWPGRKAPLRDSASSAHYFRRGYPQPDGDLLVIFEGLGVARLDRDSNVVWKKPIRAHHDLRVLPGGDIAILARRARVIEAIDPQKPTLEDFVVVLSAAGKERKRVSILEAFLASEYAWMIQHRPTRTGDILHTNSLELLRAGAGARNPAFAPGRLLLSIRDLHALAVLDLDLGRVVWAKQGGFARQHDARIVDGGRVLLFDNDGLGLESRVLELDPADDRITWSHRGPPDAPFYSDCCGTARRLENGNTLVTATTSGRAFEVTAAGDVVWEFHNPHSVRLSDTDPRRFTAQLFDLVRLPPDFGASWLETPGR